MNRIKLLLALSLIPAIACAQSKGRIIEDLSVKSKIMDEAVQYSVYLPPDYESSERYYPVVYLLHGYSDDDSGWIQFGEINRLADEAIHSGEIPPMIIIMPDGGVTYYINDYKNEKPWEDMFIKEFIPYVENNYRIRKKKEFRGISGLSMGGYGSTVLAMRHPDLFAAVAAFSAAYRTDEEIIEIPDQKYDSYYGRLYGEGFKGNQRITKHFKENSPFYLAKENPKALKLVNWYIDCGDDDFLFKGNSSLHILLRDLDIPHEYRVRDGKHSWSYWRSGIIDGLSFIGQSFHR